MPYKILIVFAKSARCCGFLLGKRSDQEGRRILVASARYLIDFEVYDQKAIEPSNPRVDIYIGIEE